VHGDDMLCGYENSNAGEILFAERRMPQANAESQRLRAELNRVDVRSGARLAAKRKSLARNHKTGRGCSGNASALPRYCTRGQANVIWQNRTMTRDDLLVWLSLAGLFASYCATIWVLFPL
jgi:hypothetical protein